MLKDKYPFTGLAEEALASAANAAKKLNQPYIGTEHMLLGLMSVPCVVSEVLPRHEVTQERVEELIKRLISLQYEPEGKSDRPVWTPKALDAIELAWQEARRGNMSKIGTEHLLLGILQQDDSVAMRLLHTMNVDENRLAYHLCQAMGEDGIIYLQQMENNREDEQKGPSLLAQFSRDLTAMAAAGRLDPVVGRRQELDRLIRTLSRRTKNNPCLIGEPGVGKTAIVEKLAAEISAGNVPPSVQNKRVLALDLAGMVAGTKYRGEFEERIQGVIRETAEDGNVLLFLDELHTLIGAGGAEGALDAANILKPALSRGEIQIIGATTVEEYRKHIEKDAALERRFQPITVEEPTEEDTVDILTGLRSAYEAHHGVKITDEAVDAAAHLSARYINDRFLPDKAIDLMDEAAAKVRLTGGKTNKTLDKLSQDIAELDREKDFAIKAGDFSKAADLREQENKLIDKKNAWLKDKRHRTELKVTENDVAGVVADWTGIPVSRLSETESVRLRKLESELHKRLIGQDEAVSAVAKAVRRGRVGLKEPSRPIGSFLFLGPTGVGKTELAKTLAEALFGKEDAMIRVDMSEFMEQHSVSKLIGSPPGYVGYDEGGQFSEKVRRNPYSVILFDEIEKAHPDIFHVLLQILDDGHITDAQGRRVDFKNTIIIMTSNAGAERIVTPKKLGFSGGPDAKADYLAMKNGVMEEVRRIFRPEFINRIDEILVFHELTKPEVKKILKNMFAELAARSEQQLGIYLKLSSQAEAFLMKVGYDEKYGARPLRRALQTHVEDPLAQEVLAGHVHPGDIVTAKLKKPAPGEEGEGSIYFDVM